MDRREAIAVALAAELDRQGAASLDVEALVDAVEQGLGAAQSADEGKRPNELNSTNDD